jgi:hypothetical protein
VDVARKEFSLNPLQRYYFITCCLTEIHALIPHYGPLRRSLAQASHRTVVALGRGARLPFPTESERLNQYAQSQESQEWSPNTLRLGSGSKSSAQWGIGSQSASDAHPSRSSLGIFSSVRPNVVVKFELGELGVAALWRDERQRVSELRRFELGSWELKKPYHEAFHAA